ncbi:MAG TPA: FHA domain-containing protein [Steroidobacter sp.]
MLSVELIDSGITLARRQGEAGEVLLEAPGMALLEEEATLTGHEAASRVRLKPLLAHTNFWRGISTEPLTRPSRLVRTSADIAYAQLESILSAYKAQEEGVLLAVPAGYSREQLGLLLGVAQETGVSVLGLVDAALAACSLEPAPARILHLDLELGQALLTILEYTGGERSGLKRSSYEIALRHGVLAMQQTLMQFIADHFVRRTRFDPLHEAHTEQRLVDQLPGWLKELESNERITLSMQLSERLLEIELDREAFISALEPHYAEVQRLVQGARVAGMPIELRVSHRVASMPGLLERLRSLRDCEVRVLAPGSAALGALQYEAAIRRPPDSLALVYQLPIPRADSSGETDARIEATPASLRPTHVLFQGRAWRITEEPLVIGWSVPEGRRSLLLPSAAPGVSRSHCTLVRVNGAVLIEDHSTYGSYVNEERVAGRTALTVGDRLRLGSPGVTLELIQTVHDDGAPQD